MLYINALDTNVDKYTVDYLFYVMEDESSIECYSRSLLKYPRMCITLCIQK